MELWGITDSGKVRKHNQDVYKTLTYEENNTAVLVVCDGMGGANAGNVASELAATVFIDHISDNVEAIGNQDNIADVMVDAVLAANAEVLNKSLFDVRYHGMGTTLTAAISTSDGEVIANIGDSRVYHISENEITQITKDHSVVEEMVDRGEISRSEAFKHPSKNLITRALGTGIYDPPDIFFLKLCDGDFMLLCSDGLSNVVNDNEIYTEIKRGKTVRESCETLVDMTLSRGAPDNVTAVLLKK
jgi:protein phosphatase